MVVAGGRRTVTDREIVEFETRFSGSSDNPSESARRTRTSRDLTASVWMICAIAQDLASRTEVGELWNGPLRVIERLSWCDSIRPGDELQLQIEILDKRMSTKGVSSWVRWHWTLATAVGVRALDLTAGCLFEGSSIPNDQALHQ